MKINSMLNSTEFLKEIEKIANESGIDYIDVVIDYCNKKGIEIETAAAIIKKSDLIKSKIQTEGENLNVLPKTSKLPI